MVKRKRNSSVVAEKQVAAEVVDEEVPLIRVSDEPVVKKLKGKWTNKERVLIFSARGITQRDRHLMTDLREMMPHSKPESKMEKKDPVFVINEIAEMKNCNKCIYFEGRKKQDLYMWMSNIPKGPCAKFYIENIHTMKELKMTGNCLKGTRPFLSFDSAFDTKAHWMLLKELFIQTFSTPKNHPKSQPFFDHIFTFTIIENRVWFRNFQIIEEDGQMAEIGPRFVLNPIKIFNGSFGGETLWENPNYVTPNAYRRLLNQKSGMKYRQKIEQKLSLAARKPTGDLCDIDPLEEEIFQDKERSEAAAKQEETTDKSKKKKKKKKSANQTNTKNQSKQDDDGAADMFNDILDGSDDDES
nr:EOG090X07MB [Leptodora kindtii]